MRLKYTKTPPIFSGWYRIRYTHNATKKRVTSLVQVFDTEEFLFVKTSIGSFAVEDLPVEWAGPVLAPKR